MKLNFNPNGLLYWHVSPNLISNPNWSVSIFIYFSPGIDHDNKNRTYVNLFIVLYFGRPLPEEPLHFQLLFISVRSLSHKLKLHRHKHINIILTTLHILFKNTCNSLKPTRDDTRISVRSFQALGCTGVPCYSNDIHPLFVPNRVRSNWSRRCCLTNEENT